MSINIHGYIKLARVLADQAGLSIRYVPDGADATAYTDGRTLYIPKPNAFMTEEESINWLYLLFHEIGHNHPKSRGCFDVARRYKVDMKSFLGHVLNYIEDIRQEMVEYDRYHGKWDIMSKGRANWSRQILSRMREATYDLAKPAPIMSGALWAWGEDKRTFFQPTMAGIGQAMSQVLPDKGNPYADKLQDGDYWNVLKDENATPETSYELAVRICREVFELQDSESGVKHEPGQPAPSEEKGDESEAQGEADGSGEDAGGSGGDAADGTDGKGGDQKGKGDPKGPKGMGEVETLYADITHSHGDDVTQRTGPQGKYRIIYKPSDLTADPRRFVVSPESEMKIFDYSKAGARVGGNSPYFRNSMAELNTKILSSNVRRLLQVYSKATHVYGQKKGKLHQKNLYRAHMRDAKGFSERVFKQTKQNFMLDVAVTLAIDGSGSMQSGSKYEHACKSALMLNDALGALQVPVEIIGFTHYGTPWHALFKNFDQRITDDKLIANFEDFTGGMHWNSDGESVLWAYNRLTQRKERRKILIVLSDGQPSARANAATQPAFLKYVVQEIEKQGKVEVYAIGILDGSVEKFYTHWRKINHPSELEDAVLSVIKTKIMNL